MRKQCKQVLTVLERGEPTLVRCDRLRHPSTDPHVGSTDREGWDCVIRGESYTWTGR